MSEAAPAPALRPLTVADLVDEIFRLYRANFPLFFGVAAVVWLPASVFSLVLQVVVFGGVAPTVVTLDQLNEAFAAVGIAGLVSVLALPILFGGITAVVAERHLGKPTSIQAALSRALACALRIIGAYLIVLVAVFLAVLVIVFGGFLVAAAVGGVAGFLVALVAFFGGLAAAVWLSATWALAGQVVVIEDAGVPGALGRSRALVSGYRWRVVGVNLLLGLVQLVLFTVPSAFLAVILQPFPGIASASITELVTALAEIAYFPVQLGTLALLYYDLRVRKEAFDLSLAAEQLARA